MAFFVIISIIPSFYPKYSVLNNVLSWYILAYLIIGLMKTYGFNMNRTIAAIVFLTGWSITLFFYNGYDWLMGKEIAGMIKNLGFYRNVYFADLASIPCVMSAIGLFYFFKNSQFRALSHIGGVLHIVSNASLDVYIISSIESPSAKLAWVELFAPGYEAVEVKQIYSMIALGLIMGVALGNIRELLWKKMVDNNFFSDFLQKVNAGINH